MQRQTQKFCSVDLNFYLYRVLLRWRNMENVALNIFVSETNDDVMKTKLRLYIA